MTGRILQVLLVAGLALFFGWSRPASADPAGDSQTVGNVVIYLGLLPAEIVRGHPPQHVESGMHGGVSAASGDYHVVVALFDARSGKRITASTVRARVSEIGLLGEEKTLESMQIAGTETYGNYFSMAGNGPFRIDIVIRLPGESQDIKAEFEHRHQ